MSFAEIDFLWRCELIELNLNNFRVDLLKRYKKREAKYLMKSAELNSDKQNINGVNKFDLHFYFYSSFYSIYCYDWVHELKLAPMDGINNIQHIQHGSTFIRNNVNTHADMKLFFPLSSCTSLILCGLYVVDLHQFCVRVKNYLLQRQNKVRVYVFCVLCPRHPKAMDVLSVWGEEEREGEKNLRFGIMSVNVIKVWYSQLNASGRRLCMPIIIICNVTSNEITFGSEWQKWSGVEWKSPNIDGNCVNGIVYRFSFHFIFVCVCVCVRPRWTHIINVEKVTQSFIGFSGAYLLSALTLLGIDDVRPTTKHLTCTYLHQWQQQQPTIGPKVNKR